MLDPGLAGKVALVTGANHGIGAATARALAAQGARVFLSSLRLPPASAADGDAGRTGRAFYERQQARDADAVVAAIRAEGGKAEAMEADLSDPTTIPLLFDGAEAAFGPLTVLVNNAAACVADTFTPEARLAPGDRSAGGDPLRTLTAASHDAHFAVNSRATALMMAEFARRHVARGADWGRIVNVSTDGASGFSGEVSYGASKHALESYSRAAATELRPFGITVNVVAPGPIQTGYITPEDERAWAPLVGQPEDVADVIVFLASHQARWLTGQLLYVGNGHLMPL